MRKINLTLCAMLASACAFAQQNGNLIFSTPATNVDYQVCAVSPNGKWACGNIDDGNLRGFVWNLTSGELKELSLPGDETYVLSVSDDGVVAGAFRTTQGTPNNVPLETAGYWKDGKWTALNLENTESGEKLVFGSNANTISANGKFVAGIGDTGDDMWYPVLWENGQLKVVDNISGSVYSVSNDGKILSGWSEHPVKHNRTCTIWKLGEDGKYTKTYMDLKSPWAASPFAVARDISSNNRYVVGFNRVWDLTDDTYTEHDFHYATGGFELVGVTNSGAVYGYHDMSDGRGRQAMRIELDHKTTNMHDFLTEKGVNLDQYPVLYHTCSVSDDEKTYAFLAVSDDSELRSIVVKLDVDTTAMAPVALHNRQLKGVNANRLSWNAPLKNVAGVKGYNIYRNGEKINKELVTERVYIDENLPFATYNYEVTAVYDQKESEKSEALACNVEAPALNAPRNLLAVPSSVNDVRLYWDSPLNNAPAIRYYEADDLFASIGGGNYSFEGAICAHKEDLALYKKNHYQITDVTFIPSSKQKKWTVNFYTSDNDDEPIYSEEIPAENLQYGIENHFTLSKPVEIPEGKDVIMSIGVDVVSGGGFQVLGMVSKKADPRYSDLIRQKTEKDFYSMYESALKSPNGSYEFNICWAMAMHFGKATDSNSNVIKQYKVVANDKEVSQTADHKMRLEKLADGKYTLGVIAEYANGKCSAPATTELEVKANTNVYKTIRPTVETNLGTATVTWEEPVDNDAAVITFANNHNQGGMVGPKNNQYSYMVATRYTGEKLKNYEDFEITGFRFFPLADADFTFILKVDGKEVAEQVLDNGVGYTLNQWNTVKLDEPIKVNRDSEYFLMLDCYDVTPERAPLGLDQQPAYPNVSDLFSLDGGETFRSLSVEGSKSANWMIGMEVASTTPKKLPIEGYNVYLTNEKQTENPITELKYVFENLEARPYQVRVNPVYGDGIGEKKSKAVTFVINLPEGIEDIQNSTLEVTQQATEILVKGGQVNAIDAFNLNGARVAHSDHEVLDITSLQAGVYVLKIQADGRLVTAKISIKK